MTSRSSFVLISSLFILSGIAALIYQVTWFKHLSYFIGSTTYAQSVVLATYMGGLAIGAWWWGKKADNSKNALKIFAWLEIGIAVYCFLYMPIFKFAENLFTQVVISNKLNSDSASVLALKILVSASTILLPTILMGGTLPVLVKYLSHRVSEIGKNVAILYFINSLGAVIGTILCGFYLIEHFGLQVSTYTGAVIEVIVGLLSLLIIRRSTAQISESKIKEELTSTTDDGRFFVSRQQLTIVLSIAGLSGMCSMMYEVTWVRLLIPILSSSTYSFTLMLAAFISGITLGSYLIYYFLPKIKRPFLMIGLFQLGIVLSIFLTMPFYEKLPYNIWESVGGAFGSGNNYGQYLFTQFYSVFFLMVIPTVFMGMTLPLASRLAVKDVEKSGESIGKVFSINTIGTVLGSLIAGLIFIPFFGIKNTLQIALGINLTLGFLVLSQKEVASGKIKIGIASILLLTGIYYFKNVSSEAWAYNIMLSEVPRKLNRVDPPADYAEFTTKARNHEKILYYNEGLGGTIVVAKNKEEVYLFTNGKGDANSIHDRKTQVSLGQTPVILHPSPDSVFVIGFGAGTTIGNVLTHPKVKYAEVAEISSEVIEGSVHFNDINEKPLSRKNLKVIKDDGVSALRLSDKKFDVIISQPSNPWSAGVGNLFTDEFFSDCKKKLRPGGYVAQWFSLYEMDDKCLKLILRTAFNQFDHVSLWHIGPEDILMICSQVGFNFDLNRIEKSYALVSDQLNKININNFPTFLSQQIMSSSGGLKEYAGTGPLNTEDLPLLEHWAPKAYFNNAVPSSFVKLDERKNFAQSTLLLKKYMAENKLSNSDILQIGLFQSLGGCKELAYYMADLNPEIYVAWAQKAQQTGNNDQAMEFLQLAMKRSSKMEPLIHKEKAIVLGNKGDFKGALNEISVAIQKDPNSAILHYQKGTFHLSTNELDAAAKSLTKAIELDPVLIDAYNNLATVRGKQGNFSEAMKLLDKAILLSNKNPRVYFNRAYAKGMTNDFSGAVDDFSSAISIDPTYSQAYLLRGRAYISLGNMIKACEDFNKAKTLGNVNAQQSIDQFCR
jgi:predicted membrane-bound spermidine synthase/tetratricopeptide (TPR) repeat protein